MLVHSSCLSVTLLSPDLRAKDFSEENVDSSFFQQQSRVIEGGYDQGLGNLDELIVFEFNQKTGKPMVMAAEKSLTTTLFLLN